LTTQFTGNDDLATLGAGFHDEAENTIASTTDGQTSDKLVTKGLSLCNGAETTGSNLFGVQFNGTWGKVEPEIKMYIVNYLIFRQIGRLAYLFWTTAVNSRMRRPFSPKTFCVLVAMMMISVLVGVTRTSTPE
jgi:hypothetical protein